MAIAIIPARGGSQRIPKKNIKEFFGKPIIQYSIETAKESGLFSEIYVSTDCMEIQGISLKAGAKTIYRPDELAVNEIGTYKVIRDVAERVGVFDTRWCGYICVIYATAPLMSIDDLLAGFLEIEKPNVSHAISIGYPPLRDAAQFYWSKIEALYNNYPYWFADTVPIQIEPERICDINTPEDWKEAERKYAKLDE